MMTNYWEICFDSIQTWVSSGGTVFRPMNNARFWMIFRNILIRGGKQAT
jgi:hypothetical protein